MKIKTNWISFICENELCVRHCLTRVHHSNVVFIRLIVRWRLNCHNFWRINSELKMSVVNDMEKVLSITCIFRWNEARQRFQLLNWSLRFEMSYFLPTKIGYRFLHAINFSCCILVFDSVLLIKLQKNVLTDSNNLHIFMQLKTFSSVGALDQFNFLLVDGKTSKRKMKKKEKNKEYMNLPSAKCFDSLRSAVGEKRANKISHKFHRWNHNLTLFSAVRLRGLVSLLPLKSSACRHHHQKECKLFVQFYCSTTKLLHEKVMAFFIDMNKFECSFAYVNNRRIKNEGDKKKIFEMKKSACQTTMKNSHSRQWCSSNSSNKKIWSLRFDAPFPRTFSVEFVFFLCSDCVPATEC